jgi:hypothetical protein
LLKGGEGGIGGWKWRLLEDRSGDQQPAVGYRNPLKMRTKDSVVLGTPKKEGRSRRALGAVEMQKWRKRPRSETSGATGKQGKRERGPEADHSVGGHQASSRDSKNECQNIVEKLTTAQAKEESTHS